jgi:hypothetical protein
MASTIKVNNIQNTCGANIISESANTITLGASGDNIVLGAGATQSGFGRTGTVDWDTTAKTTSFTAVSGTGYFVNTTSGAITVTLPASPSAGDIVAIADYARTFATNNVTIGRNGSLIQAQPVNGTIATNGQSTTFVYVDGTQGWVPTEDQTVAKYGFNPIYLTATGGTVTTCGNYKIHTFTGPGTFTVCTVGNACGSNSVSYVVVAGGGGGGWDSGGGGGAGGFREGKSITDCYTASPLVAPVGLPVSATCYPITVGGGGVGGSNCGASRSTSGSDSVFSSITSTGGGAGFSTSGSPSCAALTGGSGGGGGRNQPSAAGNTPPVSPPQGFPGGAGAAPGCSRNGGGGGATQAGYSTDPNNGGAGAGTNINPATGEPCGSFRYYAGGGGGSAPSASGSPDLTKFYGGVGGGGNGGAGTAATAGTANTGGGGGAAPGSTPVIGAGGGSGIVIIRYKYQ